jgi:hypothetical protein
VVQRDVYRAPRDGDGVEGGASAVLLGQVQEGPLECALAAAENVHLSGLPQGVYPKALASARQATALLFGSVRRQNEQGQNRAP